MSKLVQVTAIICVLVLSACASERKLHSEGPLQLQLGPGSGAVKLEVSSFQDLRPQVQRSRQRLSDGEAYGDEDFAVPPPEALLQELQARTADHFNPNDLRARLSRSKITLKSTHFSLRIPTKDNTKADSSPPPGFAAVDALLFGMAGGKTYLLCVVEVEIDGKSYVGKRIDQLSGDPPPMNYTYVAYFSQAVGDVVKQFSSAK